MMDNSIQTDLAILQQYRGRGIRNVITDNYRIYVNFINDFNNSITTHMEKVHYQHFIKLYNRRRTQHIADLENNGYGYVNANYNDYMAAKQWCRRSLKHGSWVTTGIRFYFAYDCDLVLFKLTFG